MANYYNWFKAFHIIFVIAWMAGMLYLPRLYVYHTEVKSGSEEDKRFQLMEKRLLRIIINPSMILVTLCGIVLADIYGWANLGLWFHLKLLCLFMMYAVHGYLSICRKKFVQGKNDHSAIFYRILNEVPTILMILIVILVVVKPYE